MTAIAAVVFDLDGVLVDSGVDLERDLRPYGSRCGRAGPSCSSQAGFAGARMDRRPQLGNVDLVTVVVIALADEKDALAHTYTA